MSKIAFDLAIHFKTAIFIFFVIVLEIIGKYQEPKTASEN